MSQIKTKCVFGPIPSRRLGLSLGIDLLPYKTCSMDCVYCECGATTNLTCERREYFPTPQVIQELEEVLAKHQKIDYVTFSGVGEPTLHSGIGTIIRHIRVAHPELKICLLTNASLLNEEQLVKEIAPVDLIVPSLDGSNDEELYRINRQAAGITLESVVEGIINFKRHSRAAVWLEIFILPGVNDSMESAERFRALAARIMPDKVQLNTLDRPGLYEWVQPEDDAVLDQIAGVIGRSVPVEKIARHARRVENANHEELDIGKYNELILKTLRSRPCTAEDISVTVGIEADRIAEDAVVVGIIVIHPGGIHRIDSPVLSDVVRCYRIVRADRGFTRHVLRKKRLFPISPAPVCFGIDCRCAAEIIRINVHCGQQLSGIADAGCGAGFFTRLIQGREQH